MKAEQLLQLLILAYPIKISLSKGWCPGSLTEPSIQLVARRSEMVFERQVRRFGDLYSGTQGVLLARQASTSLPATKRNVNIPDTAANTPPDEQRLSPESSLCHDHADL